MANLRRVAKNMDHLMEVMEPDETVVVTEHEGREPGYMDFANLRVICRNSRHLMDLMNENDDLPAWASHKLSVARTTLQQVYDYVYSEKSGGTDMGDD